MRWYRIEFYSKQHDCNSQATALNPLQSRNVGTTREKRSVYNVRANSSFPLVGCIYAMD